MDRNEQCDKEVQAQLPTARRRKADVWQILKLTGYSFFWHTEPLHKQNCCSEIAGKAITMRDGGGGGDVWGKGVEDMKVVERWATYPAEEKAVS